MFSPAINPNGFFADGYYPPSGWFTPVSSPTSTSTISITLAGARGRGMYYDADDDLERRRMIELDDQIILQAIIRVLTEEANRHE